MDTYQSISQVLSDTHVRRVRWEPCFNTTNERVPPFAAMQLRRPKAFREEQAAKNTDEPHHYFTQHARGGQIVWDVTKCNADAESRQDANEFVFNGPLPIEPLSYGRCTADYPCQVLHNGKGDSGPNFVSVGPVKDQWYFRSGRSAFTVISHDAGQGAGGGYMHTIWVRTNSGRTVPAHGRWTVSVTNLAANAYLPWGTASLTNSVEVDDDQWLKFDRAGVFWFAFHGKLSSSDAPRGSPLSITLYRRGKTSGGQTANPQATIYVAERDMDVEATMDETYHGVTLQRTAENVAFSGFEKMKTGEFLRLRNTSSRLITLARGVFTVASVGGFDDTSGAGGFQFDSAD